MKNNQRIHPLSLSLAIAVAAPMAVHAQQLVVTDRTTRTASGTYDTGTANGGFFVPNAGNALAAINNGSRIIGNGITATTGGRDADAVVAGSGGRIELQNATIRTTGTSSSGVTVLEGGGVQLSGGTIDVATSSTSFLVGNFGLTAQDANSEIRAHGTRITTQGESTGGAIATGGGVIVLDGGARVESAGTGVWAERGGRIELKSGTQITATGNALNSENAESRILAEGATIHGTVRASGGSEIELKSGSAVRADANGLTTAGGKIVVADSSITSKALGALVSGGSIDLLRSQLDGQRGVAVTDSGRFTTTDSQLKALGDGTAGITVSRRARADLTRTSVDSLGSALVLDGSTAVVTGGSLRSQNASAVSVTRGANADAQLYLKDGVQLTGQNGRLIDVRAGKLGVFVDHAALNGQLSAPDGAISLSLANGSSLTGLITGGDAVSLDGTSTWTLTGSSSVRALTSAGAIAFSSTSTGEFKTLTVTGDYVGNGGTLALNTVLGNDTSKTDKLVVTGSASGSTSVIVNNIDGAGAATVNGIRVVQIDGASNGNFQLRGRAVAGAYEYLLYKGGVADPNDGDWYLRTQADPAPVPTPAPAPAPPPGPQPKPAPSPPAVKVPLFRPEAGAYLGNQAAAVGMFQHSMHDRVGETNRGGDSGGAAGWVRVTRNQTDGGAGFDQLAIGTDTSTVQIGAGLRGGDSRWNLGLMGGGGQAHSQIGSAVTRYRAKGKVKGYNLGAYGTWFANPADPVGLYFDSWLQYGRYDDNVQGDYLIGERYDARTLAASVEAGYAFVLNQGGNVNFYVEPQFQAVYTDYATDDHREYNGTVVTDSKAGGLTSRIGIRFHGRAGDGAINLVQPFVTVNWWHDNDSNVIAFDSKRVELKLPLDRYELKLGAQSQLGGGWTGWGQLGLQAGGNDYRDVGGQLGVNYLW